MAMEAIRSKIGDMKLWQGIIKGGKHLLEFPELMQGIAGISGIVDTADGLWALVQGDLLEGFVGEDPKT